MGPQQYAAMAEGSIGLTAAIGGALYGGIKSGKLNRRAESILQQQKKDNQRWYDVKMSSDYTQRSDVQATLKKQRELLDEQYKRAKATNTVAGGTDEALALQKQAANQSLSQTATDIAARAADYKDSVENAYLTRKAGLEDQERQNLQQRAAATAQAASQVVNAGLNMVGNSFQHFGGFDAGGGNVAGSNSGGALPQVSGQSQETVQGALAGGQYAQIQGGESLKPKL
jgi:hypothetical protein